MLGANDFPAEAGGYCFAGRAPEDKQAGKRINEKAGHQVRN
jgi:hypothetical protein